MHPTQTYSLNRVNGKEKMKCAKHQLWPLSQANQQSGVTFIWLQNQKHISPYRFLGTVLRAEDCVFSLLKVVVISLTEYTENDKKERKKSRDRIFIRWSETVKS